MMKRVPFFSSFSSDEVTGLLEQTIENENTFSSSSSNSEESFDIISDEEVFDVEWDVSAEKLFKHASKNLEYLMPKIMLSMKWTGNNAPIKCNPTKLSEAIRAMKNYGNYETLFSKKEKNLIETRITWQLEEMLSFFKQHRPENKSNQKNALHLFKFFPSFLRRPFNNTNLQILSLF